MKSLPFVLAWWYIERIQGLRLAISSGLGPAYLLHLYSDLVIWWSGNLERYPRHKRSLTVILAWWYIERIQGLRLATSPGLGFTHLLTSFDTRVWWYAWNIWNRSSLPTASWYGVTRQRSGSYAWPPSMFLWASSVRTQRQEDNTCHVGHMLIRKVCLYLCSVMALTFIFAWWYREEIWCLRLATFSGLGPASLRRLAS